MKKFLPFLSFTGLALTLLPAFFMSGTAAHGFMLLGTLLWFATAPFWMKKKGEEIA